MALIIVLSVFNGFQSLINTFFSSFDPDLKISPVEGKMFDPKEFDFEKIKSLPGVVHYAEIIEEVALLKYGTQTYAAVVKGVPENFPKYTIIDSLIIDGKFILENQGINYAVVGQGVAYNLGIRPEFTDPLLLYVPKKGKQVSVNPARAINHNYIFPSGIFAVLEEIDAKYIIVSHKFAAELFESDDQVSTVEIGLAKDINPKKLQMEIEKIVGSGFHVKNKYQQHDLIFKTMQSEKWAAYLILVFILVIASFNILSSLSMLIIDKKEDIMILRSMGADSKTIGQIFLFEGWMISIVGAVTGTLLGLALCWLQITFEIISFPDNGTFLITGYPVQIVFTDIIFILGVVLLIGFFASWYPIKFISQKYLTDKNI